MELQGTEILVVGGAGFIGSHVVAELLKTNVRKVVIYDNFVRGGLDNISSYLADPRVSVFADGGDIRETDVLARAVSTADGVIHLAAMWLLHSRDYPRTAFDVNVAGSFNVFEACVAAGTQRLVYSSSASVYGDAVEIPMTEEHPFNNRNFYGATKIAGEAMARAFSDRYGLSYVGLRYMNVYGPGQDQQAAYSGVIPRVLNNVAAGVAPEVNGDGTQAYDFVTARDVARCNVMALQSEVSDEFYNVGTGVQTTISQLIEEILRLTGSDLKPVYKPYSEDDVRQLVQSRIGSTAKAERDLGFFFEDSLERGLQELIAWRAGKETGPQSFGS